MLFEYARGKRETMSNAKCQMSNLPSLCSKKHESVKSLPLSVLGFYLLSILMLLSHPPFGFCKAEGLPRHVGRKVLSKTTICDYTFNIKLRFVKTGVYLTIHFISSHDTHKTKTFAPPIRGSWRG